MQLRHRSWGLPQAFRSERVPWPERLSSQEDPTEIQSRPPPDHERSRLILVLGTLVVVALSASAIVVMRSRTGDDGSSPSGAVAQHASSTAPASAPGSVPERDRQALDACHGLQSLQQGVLAAARPAMSQWKVHIAAMNQLVAGRITLAQATAFWDASRRQAARRIETFDAADRLFRSAAGSLCPEAAAPPPGSSSALRTCLDAVAAGDATVRDARTTMATWRDHVKDMEHLRMGMLSPAMAQQMWRRTWRKGDQELRTYRRHDAEARRLHCP